MASRKSKASNDQSTSHPSQSSFGELLSRFVSGTTDNLGTPSYSANESLSISPALLDQVKQPKTSKKKSSQRPSAGGVFDSVELFDDELDEDLLSDLDDDDYDADFDEMIDDIFATDENVGMRNNLIALGRKYATKESDENSETSEVNRAFVKQETALENLMVELGQGAAALDRDIEMLRTSRTKSFKSLADLVSARVSMSTAKLSAIKEMNAIAKAKFDITSKIKKDAAGGGDMDGGTNATQAVQRILSLGRGSLIPDEEEYTRSVSTPMENEYSQSYDDGRPETAIHMEMDLPPAETDGDKFIQHEGEGVEYVVDINSEDDSKTIYAVDRFGNVVEDYPMPSNPEQLNFQINELAGEASDQLQRRYRVRRDGKDTVERDYDVMDASEQ